MLSQYSESRQHFVEILSIATFKFVDREKILGNMSRLSLMRHVFDAIHLREISDLDNHYFC